MSLWKWSCACSCMCQDDTGLLSKTTEKKFNSKYTHTKYLESKLLVEDRIKGLSVDFCLKFLLFIGQQKHLHIGVGGAPHVQGGQLGSLDDSYQQLKWETEESHHRHWWTCWKRLICSQGCILWLLFSSLLLIHFYSLKKLNTEGKWNDIPRLQKPNYDRHRL